MKRALVALVAAALAAGCEQEDIRKDITHRFYLDSDGAVTWMILEGDIRSVAKDPEERLEGERAFLAARRSGEHDLARAFDKLGATSVESRILREERPYLAVTEARFASVDDLVQSFMDRIGMSIYPDLRWEDHHARLMIMCDLDALEESEEVDQPEVVEDDDAEVLLELIPDRAEEYRVVLTDGEFAGARGFRVEEGGTVAVLLEQSEEDIQAIEEVDENGHPVIYSLSWTVPDGP